MVSRTGYTGELGYEVWCHPDDAPEVWDAIWESGQPHGLTPLGLEALDMLRIEAGLVFAGCEFDDQTDPFEAGIGFTVPLERKKDDFIGKEALIQRRSHPQRVLVGLELSGNEPAATGDDVYDGRARVGVITSGARSPILGQEYRAVPSGDRVRSGRRGRGGGKAGRTSEAHTRPRGAVAVLRSGEDPAPVLIDKRNLGRFNGYPGGPVHSVRTSGGGRGRILRRGH